MCEFFSFITKGDSIPVFFDAKNRIALNESNPKGYSVDSHTSIASYFNMNEDRCNKYEYNPFTKKLKIDQINNPNRDNVTVKKWCVEFNFTKIIEVSKFNLDVRGCDLKDVKLPDSIGGSLDVSGCDLKDVKLPDSIGGYLDVRGCDLKDVKLPDSIGGSLDVRGCDLKDVKLPDGVDVIRNY